MVLTIPEGQTNGQQASFTVFKFELHAAACPGDEVGIAWVIQKGHQELPELQRATALVRCTLTEKTTPFLLHLTWMRNTEVLEHEMHS